MAIVNIIDSNSGNIKYTRPDGHPDLREAHQLIKAGKANYKIEYANKLAKWYPYICSECGAKFEKDFCPKCSKPV